MDSLLGKYAILLKEWSESERAAKEKRIKLNDSLKNLEKGLSEEVSLEFDRINRTYAQEEPITGWKVESQIDSSLGPIPSIPSFFVYITHIGGREVNLKDSNDRLDLPPNYVVNELEPFVARYKKEGLSVNVWMKQENS